MKSQMIFGRGSEQALGNMPFSTEFATGSALHITDEMVDALSGMVSALDSKCNWLESTRPSRDEIHGISGHYATHEEVDDKAMAASAYAIGLANENLGEKVDWLTSRISGASAYCLHNDTLVLTSAYDYTRTVVSDTSGILNTAINNEVSGRLQAVSGEWKRATDEEFRIEGKFDGLCSATNADIKAVSALSDAKDDQTNKRIDAYQTTFSAVLQEVSGVAYHADDEHMFNDFQTAIGEEYSSANPTSGTLYIGLNKTTDLVVSGDFRARGKASFESLRTGNIAANDIDTGDIAAEDIDANSISIDSASAKALTANEISTTSFVAGSGERTIDYDGRDTISFGGARVSVNPGHTIYDMAPAISYSNGSVEVGKATQADSVSSISIGPGTASHNGSIVISVTNGVDGMPLVSNGKDTVNVYASGQENGVFINGHDLPTVIKRHAASKADLHDEVLSGIQNTSGVIRVGIEQSVTQSVDEQLRNKAIELSAYVDKEARKRIEDVQSVRDELPFYLPISGGTIWGDLTVNNVNLFDRYHSNHASDHPSAYIKTIPEEVPVEFLLRGVSATPSQEGYGWEWDMFNTAFETEGPIPRNCGGLDVHISANVNGREVVVGEFYPDFPKQSVVAANLGRSNDFNPDTAQFTYTIYHFAPKFPSYDGLVFPDFRFKIYPPTAESIEAATVEYIPVGDEMREMYPNLGIKDTGYTSAVISGTKMEYTNVVYSLYGGECGITLYTPANVLKYMDDNDCAPAMVTAKAEASAQLAITDAETQTIQDTFVVTTVKDFVMHYNDHAYEALKPEESLSARFELSALAQIDARIPFVVSGATMYMDFSTTFEDNITLARYLDEQVELSNRMERTTLSASNVATSAYDIATSAYALSGVLYEVLVALQDLNGTGGE